MADDVKQTVLDALREQANEAYEHSKEPGYNPLDCVQDAWAFKAVSDWLDQEWANLFPEETP